MTEEFMNTVIRINENVFFLRKRRNIKSNPAISKWFSKRKISDGY